MGNDILKQVITGLISSVLTIILVCIGVFLLFKFLIIPYLVTSLPDFLKEILGGLL
jgi:hypothetical protein